MFYSSKQINSFDWVFPPPFSDQCYLPEKNIPSRTVRSCRSLWQVVSRPSSPNAKHARGLNSAGHLELSKVAFGACYGKKGKTRENCQKIKEIVATLLSFSIRECFRRLDPWACFPGDNAEALYLVVMQRNVRSRPPSHANRKRKLRIAFQIFPLHQNTCIFQVMKFKNASSLTFYYISTYCWTISELIMCKCLD